MQQIMHSTHFKGATDEYQFRKLCQEDKPDLVEFLCLRWFFVMAFS